MRKVRFFLRVEGGDGPMYCGDEDDIPSAMKGIASLMEQHLHDLRFYPDESYEMTLTAQRMTDKEVAALPEL